MATDPYPFFLELDDRPLALFAERLEKEVASQYAGLFASNVRRSLERVRQALQDATPIHPGPASYRRYYPGGSFLRGGGHIQENWDVKVGSEPAPGAIDRKTVIAEIGNYNPGARPWLFGSEGTWTIRPHYPNPDLPEVVWHRGGKPINRVLPAGRVPWAMANVNAVKAGRAQSLFFRMFFTGHGHPGHPEVIDKALTAVADVGQQAAREAIGAALQSAREGM